MCDEDSCYQAFFLYVASRTCLPKSCNIPPPPQSPSPPQDDRPHISGVKPGGIFRRCKRAEIRKKPLAKASKEIIIGRSLVSFHFIFHYPYITLISPSMTLYNLAVGCIFPFMPRSSAVYGGIKPRHALFVLDIEAWMLGSIMPSTLCNTPIFKCRMWNPGRLFQMFRP